MERKGMNIQIENCSKYYDKTCIFSKWSFEFQSGSRYALMGISGKGKTTLLRILAGLEKAEQGTIYGLKEQKISMVFQENRLFEWENPVKNVAVLTHGKADELEIEAHLKRVGIEEFQKPVSQFSGGMKRRTAIVRAMYVQSDLLLLDEPFTGLDEKTKRQVIQYVLEEQRGRTLIFSTHSEEEAKLMKSEIVKI